MSAKERTVHDQGLVFILIDIHDRIDTAVLEACGWQDLVGSTPLADSLARGDEDLEQAILLRLVELNHQRAEEAKRGVIRYLRPEYQNPGYLLAAAAAQVEQGNLAVETASPPKTKRTWPKTVREQIPVIKQLLPTIGADAALLSAQFGKKAPKREAQIQDLLNTLSDLG